jgi:hypothetical protein
MMQTSTSIANKEISSFWPKHYFDSITSVCCVHMDPLDMDKEMVFRMPCGHVICYRCMMQIRVSSCPVCRTPLELQINKVALPTAAQPIDSLEDTKELVFEYPFGSDFGLFEEPVRRRRRSRRRRSNRRRHLSRTPSPVNRMIQAVLMSDGLHILDNPFDFDAHL